MDGDCYLSDPKGILKNWSSDVEDDDKVSNKMGQFGGGLHAYFFDMQLMWPSDSSDQKIKFSKGCVCVCVSIILIMILMDGERQVLND